MQGQPVLQTGFVAHEQGLEAVEPGVEALKGPAAAVQLRVEWRVVVGLPIGRAPVAGDVDFDAAPGAILAQSADIKRLVGVEKQSFQPQFGGFEQVAQLGKDPLQLERVVPVAGLGRGHGQRQALVVGQEQGVGRTARFAALVADGGPAVFGQRVAAVELDARQVEGPPVQAQAAEPHVFPGPLLAPGIEVVVHPLPAQRRAREQGAHGQPAPMAAGFELVANGPHHFGRVDGRAAATEPRGQVGQYPAGNHIFAQDFHGGGKVDGSHLKLPAFVGVLLCFTLPCLLPKQLH